MASRAAGLSAGFAKAAGVQTELLPHQQRVVDRITRPEQRGLVVAHGLGSGKTLTSIASQEALGTKSDVVVPASLRENYAKERAKHLDAAPQEASIDSIQNVASKGRVGQNPLLVVDEAHRARDPSSKSYQALSGSAADKRLLLTGSPFYNHPADLSPLVNLAAGERVLPNDREEFARRYVRERPVAPGLLDRMRGLKAGVVPVRNDRSAPELKKVYEQYVDYHPNSTEGFPGVTRETIEVPMSDRQRQLYATVMGKAPAWVARKVRAGIPPSKQEAAMMNSFLNSARQVGNTTAGFAGEGAPAEHPKVRRAFEELQKEIATNPETRAVVYSNYLGSGLSPYREMLSQAGVPFGEFTGELAKADRDAMVRDYNEGKLRALLLSSAGGEGLDLKGTRLMQVLEPHWNNEKIRQVEGRGIRFRSHDHLPEDQRSVRIQNFVATTPPGALRGLMHRLGLGRPDTSADQYLLQRSEEKDKLIEQFRELLPGYEKRAPVAG